MCIGRLCMYFLYWQCRSANPIELIRGLGWVGHLLKKNRKIASGVLHDLVQNLPRRCYFQCVIVFCCTELQCHFMYCHKKRPAHHATFRHPRSPL